MELRARIEAAVKSAVESITVQPTGHFDHDESEWNAKAVDASVFVGHVVDQVMTVTAAALQQARLEVLEEAAKVAEAQRINEQLPSRNSIYYNHAIDDVVAELQSLRERANGEAKP